MRGRGRFVDDIALPGMLHAAVLRSPHARARIVAVDTLAAESHPLVRAVITGEQLAERGLAWMPTLSHDVQAVLATDEVRYQGQEVAFVVAETRYAARDALALIDVEYAPLPAVVDARHALDADAPRVRDKPDNHVFDCAGVGLRWIHAIGSRRSAPRRRFRTGRAKSRSRARPPKKRARGRRRGRSSSRGTTREPATPRMTGSRSGSPRAPFAAQMQADHS